MEILPGDYIAGFVDGEGCFALKFRRDIRRERKNQPEYFYWGIEFAVLLRGDDRPLLEGIKATLGCGHISINRSEAARYAVNRLDDLVNKIVPFFERYPLHGKKRFDYELWREAVQIFKRSQQATIIGKGERRFRKKMWTSADQQRLKEIYEEMKNYKSKRSAEWKWLHKLN